MISRGNQEGRLYPISIQNITNWIRFANVMIWCSVSPSCTTFGASPLFSASNYGTTSRTLRRRKPYHRSNCVFMTTIRKIIDNHSRWLETTSACKTQHTTTLSRDHNHNTKKPFFATPTDVTIKKWNFSDAAQKYCNHHHYSFWEWGGIAEQRGRHNLGSMYQGWK